MIEGIETALDDSFDTSYETIDDFMELCEEFERGFIEYCYGRNERTPSVETCSGLTFAKNVIGWSRKFT